MPNYIELLNLERHIEGGYFGIFYKSTDTVLTNSSRYNGTTKERVERSAGSSIYFLLEKHAYSAWHRLKSDEIWHYYDGDSPIDIHVIDHNGKLTTHVLGNPAMENASFQIVLKAGVWFAAEVRDKSGFGLVGCTVSPGFEYQDFELAEKNSLISQYPELTNIINKFAHGKVTQEENSNISKNNITNNPINKLSAKDYIRKLNLERHIEGGYFSLCYKAEDTVIPLQKRYSNEKTSDHSETKQESSHSEQRAAGSSIYFMLEQDDFSAWHRLKSDEIWHYYEGNSPIDIHTIDKNGNLQTQILGNPRITKYASFQVVIKAGDWFAAEVRDKSSFGLVGCTVSPGFEYQDFELANRKKLTAQFPQHALIINKFTRVKPVCSKFLSPKTLGYATVALISGIGLYSAFKGNNLLSSCLSDVKNKLGM